VNFPNPAASDDVVRHADWLEAQALASAEGRASLEDLVGEIRRGGSVDALGEEDEEGDEERDDRGSSTSQRIAHDAFAEIQNRALFCRDRYPFAVSQGLLTLKNEPQKKVYTLLLLMSAKAPTAGHQGTSALFERICSDAAEQYLGGSAKGAKAMRFGTPRRQPIRMFRDAVDHLCTELGEGGGSPEKKRRSERDHSGDGGLDVVAWKHFPDRRAGKLIAFGQCAAGESGWDSKLDELDGIKFVKKFMREPLTVDPIRFFFVPRYIERRRWRNASIDGGIVFDRGRIAALMTRRDDDLMEDCEKTAKRLLKELLKGARRR
jgi:hypothetical protein